MTEPHILVRSLSKTYHVPERKEGLLAAMESLVHRRYRDVRLAIMMKWLEIAIDATQPVCCTLVAHPVDS